MHVVAGNPEKFSMMKKIRLNILGLSYSQTQSGAYALLLAEENGKRRLPIIIGGAEAQAIAIQLEGIVTPRPLTHDLFVRMANEFEIQVKEVMIYKLEEGIFYSEIVCESNNSTKRIDSRTSDAVAIALRFNAPIYTFEKILESAGVILDMEGKQKEGEESAHAESAGPGTEGATSTEDMQQYTEEGLQKKLQEAIEKEDYELASKIRDELNRRKND